MVISRELVDELIDQGSIDLSELRGFELSSFTIDELMDELNERGSETPSVSPERAIEALADAEAPSGLITAFKNWNALPIANDAKLAVWLAASA